MADLKTAHWLDEIIKDCHQKPDQNASQQKRYEIALGLRTYVFDELRKELRSSIQYFQQRCKDGEHIKDLAEFVSGEFRVYAEAPYSSSIEISRSDSAAIFYSKQIRKNPRAEPKVETGRLLIQSNFQQSFWFEHDGERMSIQQVAAFLLADLFRLVISEPSV